MFKLFARKGAGSMAVEAMLAECGARYELEDLARNADGGFPEWFHRINPRAEVPTLVLPDHSVMTESAAILIHLGDVFPAAGLAPEVASPLRPRYLRWLCYMATTIYMSDLRLYYPERYTSAPEGAAGIRDCAQSGMAREFAILAEAMGDGPFILGEAMSTADIYASMLVSWAPDPKALMAAHPVLQRMWDGVAARPAIAAVWARNGVQA